MTKGIPKIFPSAREIRERLARRVAQPDERVTGSALTAPPAEIAARESDPDVRPRA